MGECCVLTVAGPLAKRGAAGKDLCEPEPEATVYGLREEDALRGLGGVSWVSGRSCIGSVLIRTGEWGRGCGLSERGVKLKSSGSAGAEEQ